MQNTQSIFDIFRKGNMGGVAVIVCLLLLIVIAYLLFHLKKKEKELEQVRYRDPVTGGGNQQWFEKKAKEWLKDQGGQDRALVFADIIQFSVINTTYGREKGDQSLRYVYESIRSCLGDDEEIARLSLDHFVLLVKYQSLSVLLERLYDAAILLNDFNFQRDQKYFFRMAFGIFPVPESGANYDSLIEGARAACNKAKKGTKGGLVRCEFFQEKDRQRAMEEKILENRIENALADREFVVHLQPKVELAGETIKGAEALVRWKIPGREFLPPGEFILLFERDGFIIPLDLFVFQEVCEILRNWLDRGLTPVVISVNLSRVHLSQPNFFEPFETLRMQYKIPAEYIEIELTESCVFENMELLGGFMEMLHRQGYKCSLDDFGSGYSSLNILKEIPVDAIKLDREFFMGDFSPEGPGRKIVESIVGLAHSLGIAIISEGVENREQVEFLRTVGCDMIQGFVFARALPLKEFEKLAFGEAV